MWTSRVKVVVNEISRVMQDSFLWSSVEVIVKKHLLQSKNCFTVALRVNPEMCCHLVLSLLMFVLSVRLLPHHPHDAIFLVLKSQEFNFEGIVWSEKTPH